MINISYDLSSISMSESTKIGGEPTYIDQLSSHVDEAVTIKGWLYNKRGSKGLNFIVLRDGTGLCQCVVTQDAVDEASWQVSEDATQETALAITGNVRQDDRQVGGYEIQAERVELMSQAEEYHITLKAPVIVILLNQTHLCMRRRWPWVIHRISTSINMTQYLL